MRERGLGPGRPNETFSGEWTQWIQKVVKEIRVPEPPPEVFEVRRRREKMSDADWKQRIVADATLSPQEHAQEYAQDIVDRHRINEELLLELADTPRQEIVTIGGKAQKPRERFTDVFRRKAVIPPQVYAAGMVWDVGEELGHGGFGSVHEIRHRGEGPQPERVVKFIPIQGGDRMKHLKKDFLVREVGAAMMTGDYVAMEYAEAENGDSMLALILERCKGNTLAREVFERIRLSRPELTQPDEETVEEDSQAERKTSEQEQKETIYDAVWAYRVAMGLLSVVRSLRKMHVHGWSHKDVKSANIMIPEDAEEAALARLFDFGISERRGSVRVEPDDIQPGTPTYMFPSVFSNKDIDLRIGDYWGAMVSAAEALGVVDIRASRKQAAEHPHGRVIQMMKGEYFKGPNLGDFQEAQEFFNAQALGEAHKDLLQWIYDFLQPSLNAKEREDEWRALGIAETMTKSVMVWDPHNGNREVQVTGLFLNDDKFVEELTFLVRNLADEAGIEIPEGTLEALSAPPQRNE